MSEFAGYRDADTRKRLVAFVAGQRGMSAQNAERELMRLNHVGLAYVHQDMVGAEETAQVAISDYDPLAIGRT